MLNIIRALEYEVMEYEKNCSCHPYYNSDDWGMKLCPRHAREFWKNVDKIVEEIKENKY